MLIKNVSVELEQEYLNLLRKSFFLCKENIKIIVEDIKQNKYPNKEKVQEYRDLVTKYTDYCKRIIVKNQKQKDYEMFAYLIVWNLEKMSNEFNYLYRYLADFQPKVDKNTVKHLAMSFRMFEQIMEHYFKKDVSYLRLFSKVKDQFMYKELEKLLHSKKLNPNIMHRVANIVRRCNDIMGPFCGRYL